MDPKCSNVCPVQVNFLLWLYDKGDSNEKSLVDPAEFPFNFDECGDLLADINSILNMPNARHITHAHMRSYAFLGSRSAVILKELRDFGFLEQFKPDTPEPTPVQLPPPEPETIQALAPPNAAIIDHAKREAWFATGPVRLTEEGVSIVLQEKGESLDPVSLRRDLLNWIGGQHGSRYAAVVSMSDFFSGNRRFWWFGRRSIEVLDAIEYLVREQLVDRVDVEDFDLTTPRPWPNLKLSPAGSRCFEQFEGDSRVMRENDRLPSIGDNNVFAPITNSAVQQGSPGSQQTYSPHVSERDLAEQFIRHARTLVESCEEDEYRTYVSGQISIMEMEIAKAEPRWNFVREVGRSVRVILEQAIGGALATALTSIPWPRP